MNVDTEETKGLAVPARPGSVYHSHDAATWIFMIWSFFSLNHC